MKSLLSRIEFWIIVLLLIRFVGITNPPLEAGHNWRQSTGLMVARNYLEEDANIMYPKIDDNNGGSGIVGMEFPSLNYAHYLMSELFGYTHWYGRLINLLISSLGLLFFYKTILMAGFSRRMAFASTIFLATSLWFSFSRKMMPDTYCISLMFAGFYFGFKYLHTSKWYPILLFALLSSLGVLSKIPAGIYLVLLIPLVFNRRYHLNSRIVLSVTTLLPLTLTWLWYFVWNKKLAEEFGYWYNSGKLLSEGFSEIVNNIGDTLHNFSFNAFSGYIVFAFFVIGLILMLAKKEKKLITVFALTFAVFLIYIFKSGFYFYHHNYYIIPFVPVMALVAGYSLTFVKKQWLFVTLLIAGAAEGIANQQHDFFIKDSQKYKMHIGKIAAGVSEPDDLVAVSSNGNPQMLYLSHREGWLSTEEQLNDPAYVNDLVEYNCQYVIVDKHIVSRYNYVKAVFEEVYEDDDFLVVAIN